MFLDADPRWCTIFLSKCRVYRLGNMGRIQTQNQRSGVDFECFHSSVNGGRGLYTNFETDENQRNTELALQVGQDVT